MYIIVLIITTEVFTILRFYTQEKLREKGFGNQGQVLPLKHDTYNLQVMFTLR